jgi:hypothetical protein
MAKPLSFWMVSFHKIRRTRTSKGWRIKRAGSRFTAKAIPDRLSAVPSWRFANGHGTDRAFERNKRGSDSPVLARQILKLRFPERDVHRMHELAAKNQERRLTDAESEEFDNYVKVGDLVAILQSKARKLLKQKPAATKRHG